MTMADKTFRTWLDRLLIVLTAIFLVSLAVTGSTLMSIYRSDFESRFYPVFIDRTHIDWQENVDGHWSAVVFLNKLRGSCVYVPDQIETAVGLTPDGDAVEAVVEYVADPSPGSNRPVGWQRLDARVLLQSEDIVAGTVIRGSTLHQCGTSDRIVVTEWGPSVVGDDEGLPYYVLAWIEAGREGDPVDYR